MQDKVPRLTELVQVLVIKGRWGREELDHLRALYDKDSEDIELRLRLESEKPR